MLNRKTNITNLASKIMLFGKRIVQSEYFIVSNISIILIVLYFAPTLIQGKLPLSTGYLYQMSPWASYSGQFKNDMVTNPVESDVYDSEIPAMQFTYSEIFHGDYPFWLPYANSGVPNGLLFPMAVFSINLLIIIMVGAKWGTILYMALKMYIVGISIYYYLRYRQIARLPALLGSVVMMFSAHLIVNGMQSVPDSVVYAPAILYFADRFVQEKKYRLFLGLVVLVGVTFVSGFPSVTMYTLIVVVLYLAFRNLIELQDLPFRQRIKNLSFVAFAFLIGIILMSVTIFPTYEFFKETNIGYRIGRGATRLELIQVGRLINPNICGNPVQSDWVCSANYNESALYVGLLPLMLIPFSLACKKNKLTTWFFFITAVLILMIVFGVGPLYRIVGSLPLFNVNSNTRMIALLPLCFAFISATGMDNLTRVNGKKGYWSLILYVLLVICTLLFFEKISLARVTDDLNRDYFLDQRLFTTLLLICYSIIITIILTFKNKAFIPIVITLLLVINFVERSFLLGGYEGASYPGTFYPVTPAITFLTHEMPKQERVVIIGRHFIPSIPLFYSINTLTGHAFADPAFKSNLELINPGIFVGNTTQPRFTSSSIDLMSPLLDLYRVRYIVTPPFDEPIWLVSLADQREYNQNYALSDLKSFGQSITVTRSGFADVLEFYITTPAPGVDRIPANVKITSENKLLTEFDGKLVRQETGYYSIDLPKLPLQQGQIITFEIAPIKELLPSNSRLYTVNYDIFSDGSLIIDGKEENGDAAFALLQYNSTIAQKYRRVHSGDLNIYENITMGNEIPVVSKLRYSSQDSCATTLDQIDPAKEVVVEDQNLNLTGNDSDSNASIREYSADNVVIDANIHQTSMVILSDTYYPGWQATVDGNETKIYRVNCAMRGVIVAPGNHVIEMNYNPPSFRIGLSISLFTLTGLFLAGVVINTRRRAI